MPAIAAKTGAIRRSRRAVIPGIGAGRECGYIAIYIFERMKATHICERALCEHAEEPAGWGLAIFARLPRLWANGPKTSQPGAKRATRVAPGKSHKSLQAPQGRDNGPKPRAQRRRRRPRNPTPARPAIRLTLTIGSGTAVIVSLG